VLGYHSADPLEQSVAERIVVNAKEAGISITAQAIQNSAANSAPVRSQASHVDVTLLRWRMPSPRPEDALRDIVLVLNAGPLAGVNSTPFPDSASPQDIYNQQRAILDKFTVVPLVWLPQVYGLSARVRDWTVPGPGEQWPLADVWLDTGPDAGADKQP
jgi:hypothetical protein